MISRTRKHHYEHQFGKCLVCGKNITYDNAHLHHIFQKKRGMKRPIIKGSVTKVIICKEPCHKKFTKMQAQGKYTHEIELELLKKKICSNKKWSGTLE